MRKYSVEVDGVKKEGLSYTEKLNLVNNLKKVAAKTKSDVIKEEIAKKADAIQQNNPIQK